jgi:RHS repeat-associated protein
VLTELNSRYGTGGLQEPEAARAHPFHWIDQTQTSGIAIPSGTPNGTAWYSAGNNRMTGVAYDVTGNGSPMPGRTYVYDVENRMVSVNGGSTALNETFAYDGEGRRVKRTAGGVTTVFVYDARGQLAQEYGGAASPVKGRSYLFADHLGSTRMQVAGDGTVQGWWDYAPFGEEVPGTAGSRSGVSGFAYGGMKQPVMYTGQVRDYLNDGLPSGLDYFGARYLSSAQGRFTSGDPSMLSSVLGNPQSWNRYTYALNNPLRYVDPNGELWVASGRADNPYSWVDECEKNQTCYTSVAANVRGNLRVYGSQNAQDITNYGANEYGMINVVTLAGHADSNFESIQTAGREENYLGVGQAAALFNVAAAYGGRYPNDNPLVFTGGSTATGGSALDANGRPIHRSHRNGSNIDLRYMGDAGFSLTGNTAAANGNVERNQFIINRFAGQNAGLGAALTGDPARYGLGPIPAALQQIHRNHMHFQSTYPAPPRQEPRIRPGQR